MGIKTCWHDDEKRVICHHYEGEWSSEDYYCALDRRDQMLQSVDHDVIILSNHLDSPTVPKGFVHALQNYTLEKPTNQKTHIIVSETEMHWLIMKVINRILPDTDLCLYAVNSMPEAESLLQQLIDQGASV